MPEMTGYELAREIRRRPEWNDICLVAVTGYGQESDKKLAKEAGFNSHVVKPISKETSNACWHRYRLRRRVAQLQTR